MFATNNKDNQNQDDRKFEEQISNYWKSSPGAVIDKLRAFPKYVPRTDLAKFLVKSKLFEMILEVNGSVVECGVHTGGGLMTWAQLSSLLEPINHTRKIIRFDSFEGFKQVNPEHGDLKTTKVGDLCAPVEADIERAVELYDINRYISHINKIEIIKGDACETMAAYVENNKHLVVSLLYLDFDVYLPTKAEIELFLPHMPKGWIIVFDELNISDWPGETMAVLDTIGLNTISIKRFPFHPLISYAIIQ